MALATVGITLAGGSLAGAADAPATPASVQPVNSTEDLTDLSLDELMNVPVVITAGKREQSQEQAAASVNVVTAEEIDLFGYRSLAEVLRGQRGFYLHTDGLNWMAGVRGFLRPGEWNARILSLVDGRPTRENIYGQTHLDQDFAIPMEAVKRVEVVRGPGSSLYGGNAVFGVVNVVTKDGADLMGGQVRVQGGLDGTARTSVLYGTKTNDGWDFIGGLVAYTSPGSNDISYDGVNDAASNYGHIRSSDYEGAEAGFLKIRKGEFTAAFDLADRQRDNRSATYWASFFNPGSMHEDVNNVTLSFDHEVAKGQSLHAKAWYGHYGYRQNIPYEADAAEATPAYTYVSTAVDDWLGQEIHYDWQVNSQFHLLVGADATEAIYTRQHDYDDLTGELIDAEKSYNSWGLFAEGEYKATKWLTFVAGIRMDQVQRIETQFCPRAAMLIMPDKDNTIKLLYGRSFRAPNLYEMFYDLPESTKANPDLTPEVIDTYELVWERQFQDGWHTSLGGFLWKMSDAMSDAALADGGTQTQNGIPLQAYGIEGEVQRRWTSGASLRAHAALTRAEDSDDDRLAISPEWIVGASLAIPVFNKRTFLAIEPQVVGPMFSDLGDSTDATFITNIVFTAREPADIKGLDFQVGVYNLFADDARLPHGGESIHAQPTLNYPQTQFMVSLTYRF